MSEFLFSFSFSIKLSNLKPQNETISSLKCSYGWFWTWASEFETLDENAMVMTKKFSSYEISLNKATRVTLAAVEFDIRCNRCK